MTSLSVAIGLPHVLVEQSPMIGPAMWQMPLPPVRIRAGCVLRAGRPALRRRGEKPVKCAQVGGCQSP